MNLKNNLNFNNIINHIIMPLELLMYKFRYPLKLLYKSTSSTTKEPIVDTTIFNFDES